MEHLSKYKLDFSAWVAHVEPSKLACHTSAERCNNPDWTTPLVLVGEPLLQIRTKAPPPSPALGNRDLKSQLVIPTGTKGVSSPFPCADTYQPVLKVFLFSFSFLLFYGFHFFFQFLYNSILFHINQFFVYVFYATNIRLYI